MTGNGYLLFICEKTKRVGNIKANGRAEVICAMRSGGRTQGTTKPLPPVRGEMTAAFLAFWRKKYRHFLPLFDVPEGVK